MASTSATGVRSGFGWQSAEGPIEQLAERGGVDIADHGDLKRILGQHAADIVLQIRDIDLGNAFQGAVSRPAIGMIAKGNFQKLAAGQRARIGRVAAQAGDDLGANTLDIGGVEMRRCQRHPKQVESLLAGILEHTQRAAEIIPRRTEAELDGAALQPFMEGFGIQIARTLVEQIANQIADPGLVGRVLGRTASEGIFHRDQRHGGFLHEPGFDAARRNQVLDLGGRMRRRCRERHQHQAGSEDQCKTPRASHERRA